MPCFPLPHQYDTRYVYINCTHRAHTSLSPLYSFLAPTLAEMHALHAIFALASQLASWLNLGAEESIGRVHYYNPSLGGGSMLDNALNGYGEPLNVRSSPFPLLCDDHVLLIGTLGPTGYHLGHKLSRRLDRRRNSKLCACDRVVRLVSFCKRPGM